MSDLYSVRKSGLLKLKGEKDKKKKSKKRKHEDRDHKESKKVRSADRQDALDHGGWWCATEFKHITGMQMNIYNRYTYQCHLIVLTYHELIFLLFLFRPGSLRN